MATKTRAWKQERASVSTAGGRTRSNKYRAGADSAAAPSAGSRQRFWVGGYVKRDGTRVPGHFRKNPNYRG